MSRSLKLYITGLVSVSVIALLLTSFVLSGSDGRFGGIRQEIALILDVERPDYSWFTVAAGLLFWTLITAFAGALPVRMPRGALVSVAIAPIVAAMALGGPVAA